jgi:hypothetical protein
VWQNEWDVEDRAWRWNRPGGIDLRSTADRTLLARVIEKCRPDLVAIGPLYKMSLGKAGDTYEIAAAETAAAIDHLRERYGCAFWIEHHMPKATAGHRAGPIGSSLWQRWPEFGLELRADPEGEGNVFNLDRFRGDRDERAWPDQLMKKVGKWPWTPVWKDAETEANLLDAIDEDYAAYLADERLREDRTRAPADFGTPGSSNAPGRPYDLAQPAGGGDDPTPPNRPTASRPPTEESR